MQNEEIISIVKNAFELEKNGQFKNAIEVLYQGLNIEPDNVELLAQIAYLYFKLKNYEIAEEYAQKALERDFSSDYAKNVLIEIYTENKKEDKFLNFLNIVNINQTSQLLKNTIFNSFIKFNLFQNAIYKFEEIDDKNLLDDESLYLIGSSYYTLQDYENAENIAKQIYTRNAEYDNAKILLANIAFQKHEFDVAINFLSQIEKEDFTASAYFLMGQICIANKEYQKATDYISKALEFTPNNLEFLYNLATAYYFLGWFDEALKTISKAKSIKPDSVNILYLNAEIYFLQGKLDYALELISSILNLEVNHINAKLLKANIYIKKGLADIARIDIQKILQQNPENIFALKIYYDANLALNFQEDCLKTLEKILFLEPDNVNYSCKLAETLCQMNMWEEAKNVVNNIFNITNDYEEAYQIAIKVYFNLNNLVKAEEVAKNWLKINPNSDYAHYTLAKIYLLSSDAKAFEHISSALKLNPQDFQYYVLAGNIYEQKQDIENAISYYNEAFEIYPSKDLALKLLNINIQTQEFLNIEKTYNKVRKIAPFDIELNFKYVDYLKNNNQLKKAIDILKNIERAIPDKNLKSVIKSKIIEIK
ncbi:tetratricopeptide repeat protein [bacterium]|nr:tetratricopeptide repeat protein [bacterium]